MAVGARGAGPRLRALAIRFAAGAEDLPGDLAGRFLVLVRGAASPDAALAGLDAARADLLELGPAVLSPVVLSPDGPLLRVGSLDIGEDALQTVPDVLSAALARSGVDDADVDLLEGSGPLDALDRVPNAAVLRLFPPPAGPDGQIPLAWLEIAAEWVLGDATADEPLAVRLLGAPFEVTGRDAAATLHAAVAARTWCDLVHGRLDRRIRTASLTFGHAPHLTLATGGPGCNTKALLARFAVLEEVARDVQASYACVDLEETFAGIGNGVPGTGWPAHGGAAPNAVAAQVGDVVVPDAFPFQVLGPGHLERVRSRGQDLDGELLEDGRLVVVLGDPDDWLPRFERRLDAAKRATKALKDLLVTDAELATLAREHPHDAATDRPANGATARGGGPDLEHVTLDAVPHPRRGLHLTLLELASWIGHEPHSDVPRGVSPVLSAYARWYASGLDRAARQQLKPYAARLVGTRGLGLTAGPWRPLSTVDEARAWRAADWLAREQAAAWLRAAGRDAIATKVQKVRRLADGRHRDRQLALLDAALAELEAIGGDPATDEAWAAWEAASEASAWVAASEAAWTGIPDAVASAVELAALERTRTLSDGPRSRPAKGAVADAVRAAARAAAASEAWRLAGAAAARAVDARMADPTSAEQVAAVPLATAWDRALQGAASRLGRSRDDVEQSVEVAESAAQALLADLVEGGDPPDGALDVAHRAAEASRGGEVWRTVTELTMGVVGQVTWEAAQAAAAEVVDRIVRRAPEIVERAVLVAVAREVGSLAARTAVGRGGEAALEAALEGLRPAALELLDALLDVR
jgi:hypothetical protein